jgi:hypothetical protein
VLDARANPIEVAMIVAKALMTIPLVETTVVAIPVAFADIVCRPVGADHFTDGGCSREPVRTHCHIWTATWNNIF